MHQHQRQVNPVEHNGRVGGSVSHCGAVVAIYITLYL